MKVRHLLAAALFWIVVFVTLGCTTAAGEDEIVKVSGAVLPAPPFFCSYEMGYTNDVPNYIYDCNWTAPSGFPDTIEKYNGVNVLPSPGYTMPCRGNDWVDGYREVIANATSCPHFFIPLCTPGSFNPYDLARPAPGNKPVPPAQFSCSWYPNSTVFGPSNVSQYLTECTNWQNGTPQGSVDLWTGFNVHQGSCSRVTPPTHEGSWAYLDYRRFLANGWRTKVWNGQFYVENSIHSVEVGPHVHVKFSSNAVVNGSANWPCVTGVPGGDKCKDLDNQSAWSLEADHFHLSGMEAGWMPWSLMVSASY